MPTTTADPNDPPEIVEEYLRSVMTPEGTTLMKNGRPFARVVAVNISGNVSHSTEHINGTLLPAEDSWIESMNERRVELINRKHAIGLTSDEELELARLKTALRRFVDRVAPRPIEAARALHQRLLAKAASQSEGRDR